MTLASLSFACVGITAASRGAIVGPFADAALAWLGLAAAIAFLAAAPSIGRAAHRVRSPAFVANAARLTRLPRWYVVPAALVGGVASDMGERVRALGAAEARSGAAWRAAAAAVLVQTAVRVPRWDAAAAFAAVVAAITLAGVIAWQRRPRAAD